jgi:hypothetical protein
VIDNIINTGIKMSSINIATPTISASNWVNNWSNNITLSSGQVASLSASDLFTFDLNMSSNVKKYEIYEFTEDVLALSVTWKRMRDSNKNTATKLTDNDLFKNINPEDRITADKIATYYSKKIMMLKLLDNNKLTSYRKDLSEFIHSDRKKVIESTFGLAYHLPGFYDYDNQLDKIKEDLFTKQDWKGHNGNQHGKQQSLVLTPIKRLRRKTKSLDAYHYWLKTTNGVGVLITLQPSNTLIKLWEHFYNKNEPLVVSGTTFCKTLDGFEYLSIKNWEIVHG